MYFLIKFAFSRSNLLYAGPALNNCRGKHLVVVVVFLLSVFVPFKDLKIELVFSLDSICNRNALRSCALFMTVATRIGRYEFVPSFPLDVPSPTKSLACISFRPHRSSATSWMIENGIFFSSTSSCLFSSSICDFTLLNICTGEDGGSFAES